MLLFFTNALVASRIREGKMCEKYRTFFSTVIAIFNALLSFHHAATPALWNQISVRFRRLVLDSKTGPALLKMIVQHFLRQPTPGLLREGAASSSSLAAKGGQSHDCPVMIKSINLNLSLEAIWRNLKK